MKRSATEQLQSASIKLRRAQECGGIDPVSGFSSEEIIDWIIQFPELGNEEVIRQAKSVLRRHGFLEEADSFLV